MPFSIEIESMIKLKLIFHISTEIAQLELCMPHIRKPLKWHTMCIKGLKYTNSYKCSFQNII